MPNFIEITGTNNPFDGIVAVNGSAAPTFADVDGDGDLDLVLGNGGRDRGYIEGFVSYFENTAEAGARAPVYVQQTGTGDPFNAIAVGSLAAPAFHDVDGDGDLDLVVGDRSGALSVFRDVSIGTGLPVFTAVSGASSPFPGGDVRLKSAPTFGDVDGDGDADLVVGDADGRLNYWLNFSTATSNEFIPTYAENPFGSITISLGAKPALGDVDGDGDLDLVVGAVMGSLLYYENTGMRSGIPIFVRQTGTSNPFADVQLDKSFYNSAAPSFADIDHDGDLDLVVGDTAGTLHFFANDSNAAPTTSPVTLAAIGEDSGPLLITQAMLLARAVDPEGDAMTVSSLVLSPGSKGTLVDNKDGTWTYTPAGNDDTGVGFGYTISDAAHDVNGTATLDITPVNDAPTTSAVVLSPIQEDSGTLRITQAMLLVNANDVDGPAPKAVSLQKTAGLGTLVDNGDSTWNYTPAPDDDTDVSFSYSVSDGTLSAAGTATLDITPVNDAPVAAADTAIALPSTAVSIEVLANDSDVDGGALRVAAVTQGNGGTAAIQPGNLTVLYTPSTGFSGFDSFSYTVSDGVGGTASASVRVLVASIAGTSGNDALPGTAQVDYIVGLDGNDNIQARGGADFVDGGRGADTINGGDGADTLLGGDGPDTFVATGSELAGDQVDGGDGTDTLLIPSSMTIWPANFSFTNLEQISHNGLVVLHSGLVDLSSLTLLPGSNNKILGDVANNRIIGTKGDDNISDTAGNDDLRGADGNDIIQAGVGQDTLYGGNGNDRLCGDRFTSTNDGARDTFVFDTALNAATNVDQIVGFQADSQDQIQLSGSIFAAITGGATTGLDADEFRSVAGGNAQDGNDFILFDPTTGNLFYDADGSGLGAKVLFATLVGMAGTLDATDFVVSGGLP